MPPTMVSAVEREWPTTESRLGTPNAWLWGLLFVGSLAIGASVVAPLLTIQAPQNGPDWYGRLILGCAFLVFPLLLSIAVVRDCCGNRPFRHADASVLPFVPHEPLLAPGQVSFSFVTHHLDSTPDGVRLAPDPRPFRQRQWYGYVWINAVAAAVTGLVWWLSQGRDHRLLLTVGIGLAFLSIGNLVVWIVQFLTGRERAKLGTFVVESDTGRCMLTHAGESLAIDRQQFLAVQLCAARRRVAPGLAGTTHFAALELNLVWNDDSPGRNPPTVRRATLMNLSGGYYRAVPIARQLAEALDVPLLNHATDADWKLERGAAKRRDAEQAGGFI